MSRGHDEITADKILDSWDLIARFDHLTRERGDRENDIDEAEEANREAADAGDADEEEKTRESLDEARDALTTWDADYAAELKALEEFIDEGTSEFRHGETLIREDHFEDYARELAEDCGDIEKGDRWPYTCIDWAKAADDQPKQPRKAHMKTPDLPPVTLKLDTPENVQSTAHELGAALCLFMDGWTYAPPPPEFRWLNMTLKGPDGITLGITKQNGANRLTISPRNPEPWPADARYPSEPRPSITVDAGRKPAAIAHAIAARLFPEAMEWNIAAQANAKAARDYADATTTTRAALAAYGLTSYNNTAEPTGTVAGSYVRAQPNGDRVRLTIDTTPDQTRAIFDAMNANPRKD